ncbi:LapA family protein [Rhodoferax aquaticus]|uniref:DUF1049 domain-containing protein n=1 Tax=Rhodoferax aquaticus TaxID=2527691 RepID=A0A515ERG1_9BURK|nr:lipopolysaccharide assembly protein LapA domain-containing protein [Rhodoferax aquaticus]QDL55251.1 DUF1049 domain-containing protein [Rhodoferax aquaticus]
MKHVLWLFKWLLKAAIFFTLFAFALNNQHDATVRFFFGTQWTSPLVLVLLAAFGLGLGIGVLGMVPRWWLHRKDASIARREAAQATAAAALSTDNAPATPPYGI